MDIFSFLQQGLSVIVPFIILLGILIFVHELGHFLVARWCNVRVEVFSLGFGKKILKYQKGDTTYAVSLIPLGGYVKMFGEQPGTEISEEDKKVSFTHKNVYQRIAIVLAGPLMNFFFAVLVFFAVSLMGEDAKTPVLGDVPAQSEAAKAGFSSGDKILAINGNSIVTWSDIQKALSFKENQDQVMTFEIQNADSATKQLTVTAKSEPNQNPVSRFNFMGSIEGFNPYSAGTTMGVLPTSLLATLGMKSGDTITGINGTKVSYWRELESVLKAQSPQSPLTLQLDGASLADEAPKKFEITVAPPSSLKSYTLESLGLESSELYLREIVKNSPAAGAGLKPFDRLVTINNVKLYKWEDVINNVKSSDGSKPVEVSVMRGSELIHLSMTPKMTKHMLPTGVEEKRFTIGISPIVNIATPEMMTLKADGPVEALSRGFERTWDVTTMTVMSFVRLFQAKISPKNLGGVISIGQAASETFKIGISQFLQMMAIISINLFIINLLPIPVLDGGHLVFYVIEAVKGAPLSLKKMELAQQVGMALLMSLMIFALFNDFTRLFGL